MGRPRDRREYDARRYVEHQKEILERNARWRAENLEQRREYNAVWAVEHREQRREYHAKRYVEHREEYRERHARYRAENLEKGCATEARRRARKLQAMPVWLSPEQHRDIDAWYFLAQATGQTVDHKVPLQGKNVCGLHVPWNLQLLSHNENASKGNQLF